MTCMIICWLIMPRNLWVTLENCWMTILHFKVVLAAIFIKININNRKIRPYSQFCSLITSKCVPLTPFIKISMPSTIFLLDIISTLHLFMFKVNLFCLNHLIASFTAFWSSCCIFVIDLSLTPIIVSSAKILQKALDRHEGKLLIKIVKSRGPSIDPCGTPLSMSFVLDILPFMVTTWVRSLR